MALNLEEINKKMAEYNKFSDDVYIVTQKKNLESASYCEVLNVVLNKKILDTLEEVKELLIANKATVVTEKEEEVKKAPAKK